MLFDRALDVGIGNRAYEAGKLAKGAIFRSDLDGSDAGSHAFAFDEDALSAAWTKRMRAGENLAEGYESRAQDRRAGQARPTGRGCSTTPSPTARCRTSSTAMPGCRTASCSDRERKAAGARCRSGRSRGTVDPGRTRPEAAGSRIGQIATSSALPEARASSTTRAATARSWRPTPVPSKSVISSARAAAGVGAVDDGAERGERRVGDQARLDRVLALADGDRLGDLVGEDAGVGDERGLDLLLALGVGAHAGEVGAGPAPGRASGSGRSDEVMVMMTSASAPRRSRSTGSKGRPSSAAVSARRESISGCRFQPMTRSKARWRAAARSWKADWWPAPTMPRTLRVGPGEVLDRDGGGGGGAGGGQVVAADQRGRRGRCRGRRGRPSTGGCCPARARGCAASSRRP